MINYIKRNWKLVLIWIVFAIIIIVAIKSFFNGSSGLGNGVWVLMFAGLIIAAVVSREKPYLAWTFSGLAILIFLVLLGKLDTLFGWAILGLPIFVTAGFYGSTKVEGGAKTFLKFASSIIFLFWMQMFYQGHQITGSSTFITDVYDTLFKTAQGVDDKIAKTIFVIFLGLFGLALWKKSKIFGILAFVVFLSFGYTLIDRIIERWPSKLKPTEQTLQKVEKKFDDALKNVSNALGESATTASAVKNPTPRELVGNFPIYLSGNSFNSQMGKNGERRGTGEIFIPHMCEAGYQYFFAISGEYEKFFWRLPYKQITYLGSDAVAGQNVNKPFPRLPYGALTLRIGDKDGLVPMSGKSEIQAMIISPTPIFAELNINREIGDYFDARAIDSDQGNKLKNSTLLVKIERRRLIE